MKTELRTKTHIEVRTCAIINNDQMDGIIKLVGCNELFRGFMKVVPVRKLNLFCGVQNGWM